MRRKAITPERKLMHECDVIWAQIIKIMARGTCECCLRPGAEAHHMVSRSKSRLLRHSIQNGVYVCKGCHMRFHNKESDFLWRWIEKERPEDYAFIKANMNLLSKVPYKDVKFRLKSLLEAAEAQAA